MVTMDTLMRAAEIARGLEQPGRLEEMERHHHAIIAALNVSHTNGEQDDLTVFEAIAHALAQLTAGLDARARRGCIEYVAARAELLAPDYLAAGKEARHIFEASA